MSYLMDKIGTKTNGHKLTKDEFDLKNRDRFLNIRAESGTVFQYEKSIGGRNNGG